jgi:hypothetical protein
VIAIDAPKPPCNLTAPFGVPVPITELNTATYYETISDVSGEELTLYGSSNQPGPGVQVYTASRTSRTAPWSTVAAVYTPAPAFDTWTLTVMPDALTGILASSEGGPDIDLYVVTRPSTLAAFNLGAKAGAVNSTAQEQTPHLTRDGSALYFDSDRAGSRDLYVSNVLPGGFSAPQPLTELNTAGLDVAAVLSNDQLTIYWSRDGVIYQATRPTKTSQFTNLTPSTTLNTADFSTPSALSADECSLYITRLLSNPSQSDLYVARRPPAP